MSQAAASYNDLPADLPVPEDDGACDHLVGLKMPSLRLSSTKGGHVDVSFQGGRRTVLYFYPMTGVPGKSLPDGWDAIPGARGCTPQACSFRDHHKEIAALDAEVFGVSTQSTDYQSEVADRLHLPFAILSDADFRLVEALKLPTFRADGVRLVKRLTLIVRNGRIEHVFYPVFPPTESGARVVEWLERNRLQAT